MDIYVGQIRLWNDQVAGLFLFRNQHFIVTDILDIDESEKIVYYYYLKDKLSSFDNLTFMNKHSGVI